MALKVTWVDGAREPKNPPDPAYPNGIDIDMSRGKTPACERKLEPYPTPRCGLFAVACDRCGQRVVITTAGRPDDPRSVKLACLASRARAKETYKEAMARSLALQDGQDNGEGETQ